MLSNAEIGQIIDLALAEDLGKGDVTTNSLIPQGKVGVASILAKEKGILA
ncbi:MAG: nicotinate-nucleotide diphosphorylase (carboxylating), partial [Dehalococcoidales bacterium]|nr:nicotinate-nucleotide diphosphorylase (carboxylating) [Dehalococcoidales bacterium]